MGFFRLGLVTLSWAASAAEEMVAGCCTGICGNTQCGSPVARSQCPGCDRQVACGETTGDKVYCDDLPNGGGEGCDYYEKMAWDCQQCKSCPGGWISDVHAPKHGGERSDMCRSPDATGGFDCWTCPNECMDCKKGYKPKVTGNCVECQPHCRECCEYTCVRCADPNDCMSTCDDADNDAGAKVGLFVSITCAVVCICICIALCICRSIIRAHAHQHLQQPVQVIGQPLGHPVQVGSVVQAQVVQAQVVQANPVQAVVVAQSVEAKL
eukprot:TRINITY_DN19733_c0_g1_i2.p1 TRINITY_DN19733_c0_g1~~TRINITY_DN19733_c0_g1_i2.p1  ORF type:complete len:267 (+),score=36.56 TRINITY_DN19733_c0_g1_i2:73-873(+)